MRLTRIWIYFALTCAASPVLRAEYVNLKNGQQLHVTSYELVGDKYRFQIGSGIAEVPVSEVLSIEPEDNFVSVPVPPPAVVLTYREMVKTAAARYSLDEDLIMSVIAAESNFDPKAVSKRNACGLMQLLPVTASQFGVKDIFDPQQNIDAGAHYLRDLLLKYHNDLALALAAYNAGPEKVQQFGSVPPYSETVSYIRRVKRNYAKSKAGVSLEPPAAAADDAAKQKKPAQAGNLEAGGAAPQTSVPN
jgi:soluble lytic murein transglycosylase-like protein